MSFDVAAIHHELKRLFKAYCVQIDKRYIRIYDTYGFVCYVTLYVCDSTVYVVAIKDLLILTPLSKYRCHYAPEEAYDLTDPHSIEKIFNSINKHLTTTNQPATDARNNCG